MHLSEAICMRGSKEKNRYVILLSALICCAVILAGRVIYIYLDDAYRFPVNTIKITASYRHIDRKQLEAILGQYSNISFFTLPVKRLHQDLMALKWLRSATIERLWPDTLKINLIEHEPKFSWNGQLMTNEGHVLSEKNNSQRLLPCLKGPENHHLHVLQMYQKLSKLLAINGLRAISLWQRENGAWELGLSNGVLLRLGHHDIEKRLRYFCQAYPLVLAQQAEQVVSVDLRYPKGMAVQWKQSIGR